ncbi:MAG: hypothetical protein R2762_05850 [Bryobacteraceae bacterium]
MHTRLFAPNAVSVILLFHPFVHRAIKRVVFVAVLGAVGCYAWVRLNGPNGIAEMQAKRAAVRQLAEENEILERKVIGLSKETEDLQSNREVIELWIRKMTNKIKRNETKFVDPSASAH